MKNCNSCKFINSSKCDLCIDFSKYKEKPIKVKKNKVIKSKRTGSAFEESNHKRLTEVISEAQTSQTINSGAGRQKGDQSISGIISIMEELKTSEKVNAKGKKTFSIKKDWLDKLDREAPLENKEFWYLKFNFTGTPETYVCISEEMLNKMIKSLIQDRISAKNCDKHINVFRTENNKIKAEKVQLLAEIDHLKAKIEFLERNESIDEKDIIH